MTSQIKEGVDEADSAAKLWPTTRGAVSLIDGLHRATGLPWWATLSLTALGVRAVLLPFTLKQMRASSALMSEWRLAMRRAAMQHAQAEASARSLTRPQLAAAAAAAARAAAAGAAPDGVFLRPAAEPADLAQQGAVIPGAGNGCSSSSMGGLHVSHRQHEQPGSDATDTSRSAPAAGAVLYAAVSAQHDSHSSSNSESSSEIGGRPSQAPAKGLGMKSIIEEYRRIRGGSSAPGPAWLIGSPLLQISIFGTSVFAARHMAACDWPGFAAGGALWFPDLMKAAAIIHWGQGLESTAVAFPYGQMGAVMPVAIALALFANVNLSFAQPQAPARVKSGNAVMAYVVGALRTAMEWATVPVLAVAMCLPHGSLVYWLSSSCVSLLQSTVLRQPAIRSALRLPSQDTARPASSQDRSAAAAAAEHAGADSDRCSTTQLFLQAAKSRARGDAAEALGAIATIRAQDPQHARAHFAAGQLHAELQQWALAEEAYVAAASLEADLTQRARCLLGTGVAQHKQGDLEAALQAFKSASADALSAAGVTEASLDSHTAGLRRRPLGCTMEASAGAQSSGLKGDSATIAVHSEVPGRETDDAATNSSTVRADSMAGSSIADSQGAEGISSVEAAPDSVMAERIAVRALMAQASVLKQLGRLQEALNALKMAEVFDRGVEVHRRQFQAALLGRPEVGRGSDSNT